MENVEVKKTVVSGFSDRRSGILKMYDQAKADLESLNQDIDTQITANQAEIASENKELSSLKSSNESTIKAFAKLFK